MNRAVAIDVHLDGAWHRAASLELEDGPERHRGASRLGYASAYATKYLRQPRARVSCQYEVDFRLHTTLSAAQRPLDDEDERPRGWPPFLLDLLPQGFGRHAVAERIGRPQSAISEVDMLVAGARNPIGNLRVIDEGAPAPAPVARRGFTLDEVDARDESFVELARAAGVLLPGSSGVQGDAPKMLVVLGGDGLYYADGALEDREVRASVLVKMRRGKTPEDLQVLRNERAYMEVARRAGLKANGPLQFHKRTLFVPRFDRGPGGERYGQESLASLAGVNEYGVAVPNAALCAALAQHSSSPTEDVAEFVLRDLLNYALGNTDNHARNTAVQRLPDGGVRLSPLFDFAPMFRDPEGIARRFRWRCEDAGGLSVPEIVREVGTLRGVERARVVARIADALPAFEALPTVMLEEGVDAEIVTARRDFIAHTARTMREVR